MSHEPKGFFVSLGRQHSIRAPGKSPDRGISFQLKPKGVRYFFVDPEPRTKDRVRDISTQYRSMTRSSYGYLWIGEAETRKAHDRLIAHARAFYPEFVIPDERVSNPYPWVAFPMIGAAMKNSSRVAPYGVNLQIASGLREFSVQDMTARIFGEAPKQLQSAVAESMTKNSGMVNIDNLTLASLLRGYLPPNSLAEVLRMDFRRDGLLQQTDKHSANNIRLLLRRFKPVRIMRLIGSFNEDVHSDMLLRDAANQYADARKNHPTVVMDLSRQYKSVVELHESITREYRKLANANEDIPYSDKLAGDLESIELPDGAKLVWPNCTHELMDWASDKAMNNCIYAYGNDAAAGRCLLLGVLDASGKMIINIMVRGQSVVQCYGKGNQTVTDETLLKELFKGLIDVDIVSADNDHADWLKRRMW